MGKPTEQGLWADAIGALDLGMNSDTPPVELPKNQAAMLTDCTVRGAFVTSRPPKQDITLTFDSITDETNFKTKLFQGACYYKPDTDPECLICQIGGRLFKVTPNATTATVVDISIPSDLNGATNPQAWLWQFEQFVAINDGENQCIFFNGNSSTRSDGTITVLGTTASTFTVPPIGGTVNVPLTSDFLGNVGDIVLINGAQYEVVPNAAATYEVTLTNLRETEVTLPVGTLIEQYSNRVCQIAVATNFSIPDEPEIDALYSVPIVGPISGSTGVFYFSATYPATGWSYVRTDVAAGAFQHYNGTQPPSKFEGPACAVTLTSGESWKMDAITPPYSGYVELRSEQSTGGSTKTIPAGAIVRRAGTNIVTTIGLVATTAFTVPSIGAQANATLDRPYSGADGASVWINNSQWLITKVPSGPVGATVTLKNINDDPGSTQSGDITNIPSLPVGRYGVYGLGRNWVCLADARSYIASDIVGGTSGTPTFNYRDAPMKTLENHYLAGGGVFSVPASGQQINTMGFPATLDSSLGQGALQVMTQDIVFSCNAPVQRLEWQNLTNPIQTQSLVGGGALGDCVAVNGDLWFRSVDGIRSLKLARQEFSISYSNTPQSLEMNRVLIDDNRELLNFWNGVAFDNRLLTTANPTNSEIGVYHDTLIAMNLDSVSNLIQKSPPVYDGAWTGLGVFKLTKGLFDGLERCFAFHYNDGEVGLIELLPTQPGNDFDNRDSTDGKIQWSFETPAVFYQQDPRNRQLLRLNDGEMIVADIVGSVRFDVYYRPDYATAWTSWHSWEVPESPTYQPRMGFGQPNLKAGDTATGRPFAVGYHFQLKIIVTGACKILGINLYAVSQSDTAFAKPIDSGLTPLTA